MRALSISLLLLALGLTACGGGGGDGKLFIWEQMDPKEQEQLDLHLEQWMALHPGTVVERVHYETEQLRTQFQNAALAGGGPDLVYGPADQVGPFSTMGLIEALDAYLPPARIDSFFEGSLPRLARPGEKDARLWCLPDQLGNHLILCVNKALVPELPQSFAELIVMAETQTVDEDGDGKPERYGLVFNQKEPFWLVPFLGGYGGWVFDEAGQPSLNTPAMVSALELLAELKLERKLTPRECDYDVAEALFKEGKAAFIINGPWSWQGYLDSGIDLVLMPLPPLPGGGWPVPMVSAKGYSLNANVRGAQRELALQLLDFLTGEQAQRDLALALGVIPSRRSAAEYAADRHPLIGPSRAQLERGRAMPVVPEMRAIWDVMRPSFQEVMGGRLTPAAAAEKMQEQAITKIAEMRGES